MCRAVVFVNMRARFPKPLAAAYGGLPHYGGENFISPEREDYRAVWEWLARESGGGEVPEPREVSQTD